MVIREGPDVQVAEVCDPKHEPASAASEKLNSRKKLGMTSSENLQHGNRVCISQMHHEYKQWQAFLSVARLLQKNLRSTPITMFHPPRRFFVPIF